MRVASRPPSPPAKRQGRLSEGLEIYDVGATVLDLLGVEQPPDLLGKPVR